LESPGKPKFATEALFENFRIGDELLAGREYFFDHFTAPDAHFFLCCRRANQLEAATHFKRMQERPSVKKLLAFEKEVNEGLPRRPRRLSSFADPRSCPEVKV
jgi:glutathione S-transferase